MSLISDSAILYRKAQMSVVSALSDVTETILEEVSFFDRGYMESMSRRIERKLKSKKVELDTINDMDKQDDYYISKKKELEEDILKLRFRLIFFASNIVRNLSKCEKVASDNHMNFVQCIKGMRLYFDGDSQKSFELLAPYLEKQGAVEDHFLLNKVFGLLLMEKGQLAAAIPYLSSALKHNPDDRKCLIALKTCLNSSGRNEHSKYVNNVLETLEWNWE